MLEFHNEAIPVIRTDGVPCLAAACQDVCNQAAKDGWKLISVVPGIPVSIGSPLQLQSVHVPGALLLFQREVPDPAQVNGTNRVSKILEG